MPEGAMSSDVIVWLGAALLTGSLFPVWRLVAELPRSILRVRWFLLGILIVTVILGYLAYAVGAGSRSAVLTNLLVPMVFFLGACIVLIVCMMSLQTAEDLRRVATLQQESLSDPLTGAYNRRYLEDRLRRETLRSHRYGSALSVLLLDADGFKRINDQWGHEVGDEALKSVARLATTAIRAQDVLARYGGDEFVVIMSDTPPAGAGILAERLRRLLMDSAVAVAGKGETREEIRLTVSIGVAALRRQPDGPQELMARADAAMYRSKREGRNRITISGEA
jgi:diguanylate cyclase (GGDEF)-like protein